MKRKFEELQHEHDELSELYRLLRSKSEPQAHEILRRIRSNSDLSSVLNYVREGDLSLQQLPWMKTYQFNLSPADHLLQLDLHLNHPFAFPMMLLSEAQNAIYHEITNRPSKSPVELRRRRLAFGTDSPIVAATVTADINMEDSLNTAARSAATPQIEDGSLPQINAEPKMQYDARFEQIPLENWTPVTTDKHLVAHLFSYYFSWLHLPFVFFDRELFLSDMLARRDSFCSSLLVNAILAFASVRSR